jgi:hypothetical protein
MMTATCRGAPKPSLSFGAASVSGIWSCLASRAVVLRAGGGVIAVAAANALATDVLALSGRIEPRLATEDIRQRTPRETRSGLRRTGPRPS